MKIGNAFHKYWNHSPTVFRLGKPQLRQSLRLMVSLSTALSSIGATVKGVVWECLVAISFSFVVLFPFLLVLSFLLCSMAVRRITSVKGTIWQRMSQMSIILMSEVGGRLSILLMKMVVITSMVVRFTLNAASKKKGLKKVVANVIAVRRRVGKYVVINSLVTFLCIVNDICKPSNSPDLKSRFHFVMWKIAMFSFCLMFNKPGVSLTIALSKTPTSKSIVQV